MRRKGGDEIERARGNGMQTPQKPLLEGRKEDYTKNLHHNSFLPSFLVPLYNSHVQRRNRFNSGDNLPGFFSLPRFCSLSSECGGRRCSSGPMKSRWSTDTDEKTKMPASSSIKSAALALHYFPVRTESIDVIFTSKLRQIIITV